MIRSLFDTDDTSEETKKNDESVADSDAVTNVPGEQVETPEKFFEESEIARERGGFEETVSVETVPEAATEPVNLVEALDTDEDFLELEKAVSQIEDEVGKPETSDEHSDRFEPNEPAPAAAKSTAAPTGDAAPVEPKVIQTPVGDALKKQSVSNAQDAVESPIAVLSGAAVDGEEFENTEKAPVSMISFGNDLSAPDSEFKPQSKAAIIRQSGLAWSAAIVLFGSIVFLMIIGWFADLLIGSTPWGLGIGIVIGAILGFYQFFKLTSEILKNHD